jgi:FkbM family methyltransferase
MQQPWLTWFEYPGDSRPGVKIRSIITANDGDICLASVTEIILKDETNSPLIVDIGFAQGWWSCFCCEYFPSTVAIGFEPNETSYQEALLNIQPYPQIQLHNLAISDHFGVLPFCINGEESNSRISEIDATTFVACDTLNKYIGDKTVTMLKIDTEGHDMIILQSILPYIEQIKNLVFELSVHWYDSDKSMAVGKSFELLTNLRSQYKNIFGLSRRGIPTLYTFLSQEDILWFLNVAWSFKYQIDIFCTNSDCASIQKKPIQSLFRPPT